MSGRSSTTDREVYDIATSFLKHASDRNKGRAARARRMWRRRQRPRPYKAMIAAALVLIQMMKEPLDNETENPIQKTVIPEIMMLFTCRQSVAL